MASKDGVDLEALATYFDGQAIDEAAVEWETSAEQCRAIARSLRLAARVEAAKGDATASAAAAWEYACADQPGFTETAAFKQSQRAFAAGWRAHERAIGGGSDE